LAPGAGSSVRRRGGGEEAEEEEEEDDDDECAIWEELDSQPVIHFQTCKKYPQMAMAIAIETARTLGRCHRKGAGAGAGAYDVSAENGDG